MDVALSILNGISCGVAIAGAAITSQRRPRELAYTALSLLFTLLAAVFLTNIGALEFASFSTYLALAQAPLQPILPVLLWFYVDDISSTKRRSWQPKDIWHFLPAALMFLASLATLSSGNPTLEQLLGWTSGVQPFEWNRVLLVAATAVWIVQTSVYLVVIYFRLRRLRATIREYFGSTEGREMAWLRTLTVLISAGWVATVWYNTSSEPIPILDAVLALLTLGSTMALLLWGIRQAPALQVNQTGIERVEVRTSDDSLYAHSRLGDEHMARIADRIRHAICVEKAFRDPELSLGDLAKLTGVRPQYLSQTLSRWMSTSFFEFCAKARVEEACRLLIETNDPVTQVALNAGFNSRSAFYGAFREETKMTPTAFRSQKRNATSIDVQTSTQADSQR